MEAAALVGFFVVVLAAASTGGIFRPGAWYASLNKPVWCPPNWLFAPAWAVLYVMIAISGWLVWRAAGFGGAAAALAIYALQLVLNAAWSGIFFGLQRMGLALVELALLWVSILATIIAFSAHDALAAWLLVPYLAWVTFAGGLNYALVSLNPGDADAQPPRV